MPQEVRIDRLHAWLIVAIFTALTTFCSWIAVENNGQSARISVLEGQMKTLLESLQHGE